MDESQAPDPGFQALVEQIPLHPSQQIGMNLQQGFQFKTQFRRFDPSCGHRPRDPPPENTVLAPQA